MVRKMLLSWMVTLTLLHSTLIHGLDIYVANGGPWGDWGWLDTCPPETVATGFDLKVEPSQGEGDDTALNAIKLFCTKPGDRTIEAELTSTAGGWGSWTGVQWCPSGYLVKFLLQVEEPLPGDEDDTAANNIMFQCSDDSILIGAGGPWGTWGEWSDPCTLGICGMETKVQPAQGGDLDDTALNDVKYRCCTELEKKNEEER